MTDETRIERILDDAELIGVDAIRIEAPANRCLPSILEPQWPSAMLRPSAGGTAPITASIVDRATEGVIAALDASLFVVRVDRLTPSEKRYLRAMSGLGSGPYRSEEVARELGTLVTSVARFAGNCSTRA